VRGRVAAGAALCATFLGGCTSLFHSSAPVEQVYYLRAAPEQAGVGAPAADAPSLRVGRPLVAPGLDTAHIMLVMPDHRMNFYTGSRWPAPLAEVVEALMLQTLRASGNWSSVEGSTSGFPSNYLLQCSVRRFEADYSAGGAAPSAEVVLDCLIGRREGREVLTTFTVTGSAPAAANRMTEVVSAFEQASRSALGALSQQVAAAVRSDREHAAQNGAKPDASINR
jgi:cholesterol transport system auxiliary component